MFKGIFKNALRALRREIERKLELDKNPLERKSLPYHLWAKLTRCKAAPIADTRQCIRRALAKKAFFEMPRFEEMAVLGVDGKPLHGKEQPRLIPRAKRRAMARALAKNIWRRERGLVAA